jgi:hypothetical protein
MTYSPTDPNPHQERVNKQDFLNQSNWNERGFGLSTSLWGFAINVSDRHVGLAFLESVWLALWGIRPLAWLRDHNFLAYRLWSWGLGKCDGKTVGYLPITNEQAMSLYPDKESFMEIYGWAMDDEDDWDPLDESS